PGYPPKGASTHRRPESPGLDRIPECHMHFFGRVVDRRHETMTSSWPNQSDEVFHSLRRELVPMKNRSLLAGAILAAITASAQAEVSYEYVGYFRLTNHETAVRFATGVADENGGLFFGDNGTDHIY